ncbi:baseplate J/gp47 family protein [Paenibacillus sp. IHBB 10380]|uniref:baseplate J/gp47 family protein n=1 Tax=Paenibacillus sp. IHBB 10380 TaxID=1566358 RepID=UPI0005CFDCB9|nr:baseplate J/gp47 family protein [Paenibacillus sp. IHBB 10380]AJS59846.1 baseplate J protein [Paenibacillus sp. IHBB 10380]
MYEDRTFENILERMLDIVPDGIDKREGSIIYDALAPAAAEFAQAYIELEINANLRFPDTATDEYLDRSIAWSGIARKKASKAKLRGVFYNGSNALLDIPIGSRFSLGELNYKAVEKLSLGNYRMECETTGSEGNRHFGAVIPIDYINDLGRGEIMELLVAGEDRETDGSLYDYYQERISRPITSGNRYQYELWAREIPGVGRARAFPIWDGEGTVKVVILDNDMRTPATAIVNAVQAYIDPTQDGMGEGASPIGAKAKVVGASEVPINISVTVVLATGATIQDIKEQIETGTKAYLKDLAFNDPLVRYTRIQSIILGIPPVIDYSNLLVNGGTQNIEIPLDSVAVLGTVSVS